MKKLPSSTLVEVIVALVIITLTFGFIFRLTVNVNRSENIRLKTNASLLMNEIFIQTKIRQAFENEAFDYGYLLIEKKVTADKENESLYLIHLIAVNRGKKEVLSMKELIYSEQ